MGADGTGAGTPPQPPKSVWQQMSLGRLRWVAVASVLVVTAAFGGLDTVNKVTPVEFGQTYDDGPLQITPRAVTVATAVPGLDPVRSGCRFLVLEATIENDADNSVPFPPPAPTIGTEQECDMLDSSGRVSAFTLAGTPAKFVGAIRTMNGAMPPTVEPGFSQDYRLVWLVPETAVAQRKQISIVMPHMEEFVSTYRIAEDWAGAEDRYGELKVTLEEAS